MRHKVLVIDDDPDLRELLAYNLKKAGLGVCTAADGIEGLNKARALCPDLILLDLMLPHLDGFSVCELLRNDRVNVPILILTAMSSQLARLASLESGATDYMPKPFEIKQLLARVQALIGHSEKAAPC